MQGFPPQSSVWQPKEEIKHEAVRRVSQRAGGGGLGCVTVTIYCMVSKLFCIYGVCGRTHVATLAGFIHVYSISC